MAARNTKSDWDRMPSVVTDEQVETFAVVGTPREIPDLLRAKYDGLLDRVSPYYADPMENPERWKKLCKALNDG
jgi:hypothetical protein